jgi:hypothetical protein
MTLCTSKRASENATHITLISAPWLLQNSGLVYAQLKSGLEEVTPALGGCRYGGNELTYFSEAAYVTRLLPG